MKKIIKYPKFTLLALSFVLAYILFSQIKSSSIEEALISGGYPGMFVSGILYAYGFTSGIATAAIIIISKSQAIILAGIIAGLGSLVGDLIIFRFIRGSFKDEIKTFQKERLVKAIKKRVPKKILKPIIVATAILLIASPMPDEIGVSLLATSTKISIPLFSTICFLLNTAGIFTIILITRA